MTRLQVSNLSVRFPTRHGEVSAVSDVDLDIGVGETVGLVGESGCGKSTLGKAIMRLIPASGGTIKVDDQDVTTLGRRALAPFRTKVQMVFQDPQGSLNPRQTVGKSIARPLQVAGRPRREIETRVNDLLMQVGLPASAAQRYPHEFSGGQRQRIGIARALALSPSVVICDEPVSALDVSVRAQVINLLKDIQARSGVSYLFISHDLSVIEHVSDRLIVMYLGRVVESGPTAAIWQRPAHPYTRALLAAAPLADPVAARHRVRTVLKGELPSPHAPPSGCAFHTRCPQAQPVCAQTRPVLRDLPDARRVACHFGFDGEPVTAP
ncbi:ATP-binding cassette domain-containing protein [Alcaligenaceae bacterium C4P045]|nr:ATP-binding cassette domain-containing protein [Alcaligenaceae bacterium C4P045]